MVRMRRNLVAKVNQFAQYELCFGNEFYCGNDTYNIKSTGFTVSGSTKTAYITDVPNEDLKTGIISIKFKYFTCLTVLLFACYTAPKIKGFDRKKWLQDLVKCDNYRTVKGAPLLINQKEIILGSNQNEIIIFNDFSYYQLNLIRPLTYISFSKFS